MTRFAYNFIVLGLCLTLSQPCFAAGELVLQARPGKPPITALKIDSVDLFADSTEIGMQAIIKGKITVKDLGLALDSVPVELNGDGVFEARFQIRGVITTLRFTAIDPKGKVRQEDLTIQFPGYGEFKRKRWYKYRLAVFPGIMLTQAYYKGSITGSPQVETLATIKIPLHWRFRNDNWDLGFLTYGTLLPITFSRDPPIRYLGFNARVGYRIPQIGDPWRFGVSAGYYYATTIVKDDAYGYSNVSGPQIYPSIRYKFEEGKTFDAYFKYSPIFYGVDIMSLKNRELALGATYTTDFFQKTPIQWSIDLSHLQLILDSTTCSSLTLSLGFSVPVPLIF